MRHNSTPEAPSRAAPFLKWAGGKRWLVRSHPEIFEQPFRRYLEPFVGSGAVFFALQPTSAILSDSNNDLITTYRAIKSDWRAVWLRLSTMNEQHSQEFYYATRSSTPSNEQEVAARFIYLNRTCWNGLYRVNRKGEFNVPIGTKSDVLAGGDFSACAAALADVTLQSCDFETTLRLAGPGDLVFVDPPYTVKHNMNGFVKYNQVLFSWNDQVRLRDAVKDAACKGAKVIVTNAAHESVKDLYANVGEIFETERASVIAGKSAARRREQEIIIRCF